MYLIFSSSVRPKVRHSFDVIGILMGLILTDMLLKFRSYFDSVVHYFIIVFLIFSSSVRPKVNI